MVLLALLILGALAFGGDTALAFLVHRTVSPAFGEVFDLVSEAANATALTVAAIALYTCSRVTLARSERSRWAERWERARQCSVLMLLVLLSGGLLTWSLKVLVARARPAVLLGRVDYHLVDSLSGAPFNAFPSGHAFTAYAGAFVLSRFLPGCRVPLFAAATIVSACRVLALEQFTSDVMAAAFIAAACVHFWAPVVQEGSLPD